MASRRPLAAALAGCALLRQTLSTGASGSARRLPEGSLIVGYANTCDSKVIVEAELGVNVIIWFAVNLVRDAQTGEPAIRFGEDVRCIAQVAKSLADEGMVTTHLLSIGGWDAPHPDTTFSGQQWWEAWDSWNKNVVAQPDLGFAGFDGIDWDLEGNDDPASQWNHFTPECMELVGTMSQAAKAAGYLVTLVPPQSYLDVEIGGFDLSLRHSYPDYRPDFYYHGRNVYALWLAKYDASPSAAGDRTFDLVSVQLYESWSRAGAALASGESPESYLERWIRALEKGAVVNFTEEPDVDAPPSRVAVEPRRLVVGLSFGSPDLPGKSPYFAPESVGAAFAALPPALRPRGAMFWNLAIDGGPVNGTSKKVSLAVGLNSFLHARPQQAAQQAKLLLV